MDRREIAAGVPLIDAIADPDEQWGVVETEVVRRFGADRLGKWRDSTRLDLGNKTPDAAWNQPPAPRTGDMRQQVANVAFVADFYSQSE